MENNSNRFFVNVDQADITNYKKVGSKFIKFLIRCEDDLKKDLVKVFKNATFCKKPTEAKVRDKVIDFDFDKKIMIYDNSKAKELIVNHSVLYTYKENVQNIKDKLTKVFPY